MFFIGSFFFSSRRRHTRYWRDWSSDVCSSDLASGRGPCAALALLLLRAVAAASLLAVADTLGVQRAADDLVTHAREVLHPAAAHEHHRVLLQVVAHTGDVGGDLDATGEADAGDLEIGRAS